MGARPPDCYLCLQHEFLAAGAPDALLAEQDRVISQLQETDSVISSRQTALQGIDEGLERLGATLAQLNDELDARTASFVSARTSAIRAQAEQIARFAADIDRLNEYLRLVERTSSHASEQADLMTRMEELQVAIDARQFAQTDAEEHIAALERRLLDYLQELHIPQLRDMLTVRIDGPTWLPRISNRTFDELSSQGLKTLVNAAHALAHHTVAIDRGLPLPGLLILDGLSANTGRDGFDGARVEDLYRLLRGAATEYQDLLQIIAVDNEIPPGVAEDLEDCVVLTLSQADRLIRTPAPPGVLGASEESTAGPDLTVDDQPGG